MKLVSASVAIIVLLTGITAGCLDLSSRDRAARARVLEDGVRFSFYAPAASRVQLGGDWPGNNWARGDGSVGEADIGLMTDENDDGTWEIIVALAPGRYQYMFWVDENRWHLDPANPEEVEGGPAGTASQIIVFMRDGKLEVR